MCGLFNREPLHKADVARIAEHKYKSNGKSICEPLLQPFWTWSVKYVPKSVAPNSLTVAGLIGNVISIALFLYYDPALHYGVPVFVVLLHILALFLYQTLDSLDGLHARQTNTCSQLGELLDHGCDAISMFLLPFGYFSVIGLGRWPILMFVQYFILNCVFYTSHWQCYVTGVIEFDSFSVTESLLISMFFSWITAIFGVQFWEIKEPILGMELKIVQFVIVLIGSTVLFCRCAQTISIGGTGKFGTTVANTSVLFPICPLALVIGSAVVVACRSPTQIFQNNPSIFLIVYGAVLAKISQNLVVAHMTKSGIRLLDTSMFGPFCLHVNMYFDCPVNEKLLLWFCCIWVLADLLNYSIRVSIQVAQYLNINIFSVERPPGRQSIKRMPSSGTKTVEPPVGMPYLRSQTRKGLS